MNNVTVRYLLINYLNLIRVNTEGAVHRADVLRNGFLKILQC